jgi:hypothetical protein
VQFSILRRAPSAQMKVALVMASLSTGRDRMSVPSEGTAGCTAAGGL